MRLNVVGEALGAEADGDWCLVRGMMQEDHYCGNVINGAGLFLTPAGVCSMHQLQHAKAQCSRLNTQHWSQPAGMHAQVHVVLLL